MRPGRPLEGTVPIEGAKNSVLKLMAATLMAEGEFTLRNVPRIIDVEIMSDLLVSMGVDVHRSAERSLLPSGIRWADLSGEQRGQFAGLIKYYLERVVDEIAAPSWRRPPTRSERRSLGRKTC